MATKKVTVTLDERQLDAVRRLVEARKAPNVSAFVQRAVDVALSDAAGWQAMLDQALIESGGPPTRAETRWADGVLGPPARKKRSVA